MGSKLQRIDIAARGSRPPARAAPAAMVCIRQATVDDLLQMQRCNLLCLPENYQLKVRVSEGMLCSALCSLCALGDRSVTASQGNHAFH